MGIFAKEPLPGRVKTRLAAQLGADGAASFYTELLADTVTLATESSAARVVLFHDGNPDPAYASRYACVAQGHGDLGARLAAASDEAQGRGWMPLVFLGSDSPDLPPRLVDAAGMALHDHDLCLGATPDGGVWCIGLRRPVPELFADQPWSDPETGDALRNRADALGLKRAELDSWYDVDEPDDMVALAARLADAPRPAPRTRRWLHEHDGPWGRVHGGTA